MNITWKEARSATLHCLTGCALGEVLGMLIGVGLGLHNLATITLSIALAFVFGYSLTTRSMVKSGLALSAALTVAFAADTASIALMEVVDNLTMLIIPGAMNAGLTNWVFYASMLISLTLAFFAALPLNRYLMNKGKGHAVAHAHHEHMSNSKTINH